MQAEINNIVELAHHIKESWEIESDYVEQLENEVRRLENVNQQQAIKILDLTSNPVEDKYKNKIAQLEQDLSDINGELKESKLILIDKVVEIGTLNNTIEQLGKDLVEVQASKVDTVSKSKLGKLEKQIKALQQEKNQAEQKLKAFSGVDIKATNTKLNNLKKRNTELLNAKELLIKENKAYRIERDKAEHQLSKVREERDILEARTVLLEETVSRYKYREEIGYSRAITIKDDAIIALMPHRFRVSVDGVQGIEEQHHLLYSDRRGIWKQVSLDPEGRLSVARPYSNQYAERTQKIIENVLPQVSDEDKKFMHDWLTRLKENSWNVTDLDVLSLRAGKILSMDEAVQFSENLANDDEDEFNGAA